MNSLFNKLCQPLIACFTRRKARGALRIAFCVLGSKQQAQRDETGTRANGETGIRGQKSDNRGQVVQSTEYRTAEQGTAE